MSDIWKSFCYVEVLIVTIVQESTAYSKVVNNCMYWYSEAYCFVHWAKTRYNAKCSNKIGYVWC